MGVFDDVLEDTCNMTPLMESFVLLTIKVDKNEISDLSSKGGLTLHRARGWEGEDTRPFLAEPARTRSEAKTKKN